MNRKRERIKDDFSPALAFLADSKIYDSLPKNSCFLLRRKQALEERLAQTKGVKIMATTNKPTHTAYVVTGKGDKANWHEIGAVWVHKDGEGFDLTLDAIPLNGRIVCRQRKPKPATE